MFKGKREPESIDNLLIDIRKQQTRIVSKLKELEEHIMAEIDDLNTNLAAARQAVADLTAKIDAIPAPTATGVDPAAVATAAAEVAQLTTDIQTQTARLP